MEHTHDPETAAADAAVPATAPEAETPPPAPEAPAQDAPETVSDIPDTPPATVPDVPEAPPVMTPPEAPPAIAPDLPGAPPAPRRRRGRTTLLIAAALVLGAVAGVCGGYVVQADREPTPLPPLSQGRLGVDDAAVVSGPEAPRVKTEGDLRKLLVKKPSGADTAPGASRDGDWMPLYEFADGFKDPEHMFTDSVENSYRRGATTAWASGNQVTHVALVQFHDDTLLGARDYAQGQLDYLPLPDWANNAGKPIPGSDTGHVYVFSEPDRKPGYLPLYEARAVAVRGDVVMDIRVYDSKRISESYVMGLAKKQLERL